MKTFTLPLALLCALALSGCRESKGDREALSQALSRAEAPAGTETGGVKHRLGHALGFSRRESGDSTWITVHKPWQGAQGDFTYLLIPGGGDPEAPSRAGRGMGDTSVIPVPVVRAVTLTTTNLRHMETVGALDALAGLGGGRFVCSPAVRARLGDGRIRDVGDDTHLDLEALVSLRPDLLFTFVVGGSSDGGMGKLAETRIPTVIDASYMEENPLGRAEWIKFTAAFFGKQAAADSAFAVVDSSYRALAALGAKATYRPTVMVGAPFGGVWWVAGGHTYVARLLADAGADYLWAADTTHGSLNLDLETVLAKAAAADVWLNGGEWKDLAAAKAEDPRYALFKAWQAGRIWNNDAVLCAGGGRDFYETGASRPDWILADLIAILHPELLPDHKLRWYRRLAEGKSR